MQITPSDDNPASEIILLPQPFPLLRQSSLGDEPARFDTLRVASICHADGSRLTCRCGRYFPKRYFDNRSGEWKEWYQYVQHPEEEAMQSKLQRLFPGYEIHPAYVCGDRCGWEAVQAQPCPQEVVDGWRASLSKKIKPSSDTNSKKPKKGRKEVKRHGDAYTVAAAEADW